MDCNTAHELLPWYLNGSLDEAERKAVDAHLEGCPDCRAELAVSREAWLLFGGHPSSRQLVAYAAGERAPAGDPLEAHLAGCERCAQELSMVRDSRRRMVAEEPAAEAVASPAASRWPLAAAAAALIALVGVSGWFWNWRLLAGGDLEQAATRQRIEELESEIGRLKAGSETATPDVAQRLESLAAQSAELAAKVTADQRQVAALERQLAELSGPQLNVAIADLWPDGFALRGPSRGVIGDRDELGKLPGGRGAVTLILNSELAAAERVERLEVRDSAGRPIHDLAGLEPDPDGGFTLNLPTAGLEPGTYRILLYSAAASEPLESYSFVLD